jgi:hypothetical protein
VLQLQLIAVVAITLQLVMGLALQMQSVVVQSLLAPIQKGYVILQIMIPQVLSCPLAQSVSTRLMTVVVVGMLVSARIVMEEHTVNLIQLAVWQSVT